MLRFDAFELEEEERALRRGTEPVPVEPLVLDLLLYLVERRDRMVGKEELLDALWPDTHVTPASLRSCMGRLRQVLGDRRSLIKTYPRRGYRFVGAVVDDARDAGTSGTQAAHGEGVPDQPPFAGRAQSLRALDDARTVSRGGRGVLALISGEQGIGKTRLVEELLARHGGGELLTLVGRCFEGDATPPFWPWVLALRACAEQLGPDERRSLLVPGEDGLARLVPEWGEPTEATPAPAIEDPAQARYRLFHDVTSFFRRVTRHRPVVLVLEDIHWADRPSLLLLRYLTRELGTMAMLALATYRSEEPTPALAEVLPGLHTVPSVRVVPLRGLAAAEVGDLVRSLTGQEVSTAIGERIHRETDGNPFFVEHLAHHLVEQGGLGIDGPSALGDASLPERVRSVLQRRLDRLGADCRQTLAIASVIGREFDVGLLNAVRAAERGETRARALDGTLHTMEEAARARMLEPPASASGRARFVHAILREFIYRGLGTAARSRRHRRIADELARVDGGDGRSISALADHFVLGANSGPPEPAIHHAVQAARDANARFAFEVAAERFGQALALRRAIDPEPTREQIELQIEIARARWNAGEPVESRRVAELAAASARKVGDGVLLAEAALASELTSAQWPAPSGRIASVVDVRHARLLEEAMASLPPADGPLRARLLARLGWALYFHPDHGEERRRLSGEALAMARRLGDFATLFTALAERHFALMDPDHGAERLAVAQEMIWLAEAEGSRQALALAYGFRAWDTGETGAMRAADADMAISGALAAETRQPILQYRHLIWRSMVALLEGRWDDVARLCQEAHAFGSSFDEDLATLDFGSQLATMQVLRGAGEGWADQFREAVARYPSVPPLQAGLAYAEMMAGNLAAAHDAAEVCLAGGLEALPWDSTWLAVLGLLSMVYSETGDRDRMEQLHAALLPYGHLNVLLGFNAIACFGLTTRSLGCLAAGLEQWDEANVHFDGAIAAARAMNARPWVAFICLDHARALARRGRAADRGLLEARREEAERQAHELGLAPVLRRIAALDRGEP
jgi:DNA-binding winged helix-turn-helix (wHTH) protein